MGGTLVHFVSNIYNIFYNDCNGDSIVSPSPFGAWPRCGLGIPLKCYKWY